MTSDVEAEGGQEARGQKRAAEEDLERQHRHQPGLTEAEQDFDDDLAMDVMMLESVVPTSPNPSGILLGSQTMRNGRPMMNLALAQIHTVVE